MNKDWGRLLTRYFEVSDFESLRERLRYLASGEGGKLIPVIGSGLSYGLVPGTSEMTRLFLAELNESMREGLSSRWTSSTPSYEKYQRSAEAVGRQRGDRALTRIIRRAVLKARIDDSPETESLSNADLRQITRDDKWALNEAHRGFADFYSRLPSEVRGPIITTNFDPLIEVALRARGVTADPVPVTFDDPPNLATLANMSSTPVLHMHGYFAEDWSVNSLTQLRATRIQLESLLSNIFTGATVMVLGYGGWEDSFMRVLELHARQQTLLNAEIIWCAHSEEVAETLENATLRRLSEGPGFQLFSGIDAFTLFDAPIGVRTASVSLGVPRGWTPLPVEVQSFRAAEIFSGGALPSWSDAVPGRWPLLSGASDLFDEVRKCMVDGDPGVRSVAAIGPLGEGKSMAARQVAMAVGTEHSDWNVLWREPTAPPLTSEWVSDERDALGNTLFCFDEADLSSADIGVLRTYSGPARTVIVMVAQDRLWWTMPASVRSGAQTVIFDGLTSEDAEVLAQSWHDLDAAPLSRGADGGVARIPKDQVARKLIEISSSGSGSSRSTLFGAILAVREADSLRDRIGDLMEKLSRTPVRVGTALSLADVYGVICAMQIFVDKDNSGSRGATRNVVSALVNGEESLTNVAILDALGREANITFAGRHVFARHPLIADAVVSWLRSKKRLGTVCGMASEAGARMKTEGSEYNDYADAFLLAKHVYAFSVKKRAGLESVALESAARAVRGTPALIEPRINYLSIARKLDTQQAYKYAHAVASRLSEMSDFRSNTRVFLNELALVELQHNQPLRALGVTGLILHNGTGFIPDRTKMEYGLATMARCYSMLLQRDQSAYGEGASLLRRAARDLMDPKEFSIFVDRVLPSSAFSLSEAPNLPVSVVLDRLARVVTEKSFSVVKELKLPFQTDGRSVTGKFQLFGRLDFSELKVFASR